MSAISQKPKLIILFGSAVRGTAGRQSDIDAAVLKDHPLTLKEKAALTSSIAKKLGASEEQVDLVDLWNAPPLLQHQIAQKGKLLEGDELDFIRFKILAWKRYLDTAKLRRIRDQALAKIYGR